MATIDLSRIIFNPQKHYSSVRMQQGRVITDEDWNENERIENENRRRVRVNVIGPHGSPDQGFHIAHLRETDSGLIDFDILAGIYYLGGLRLDLEEMESYRTQKDWLRQSPTLDEIPSNERFDLVFLTAWQQPVSAVEDSEIFEVALGGPDTSARIRTMRRVRIFTDIQNSDCGPAWQKFIEEMDKRNQGVINEDHELIQDTTLTVDYIELPDQESLCTPSVAGGYLGAENQAIRVQLVDRNHLTWGFNNAAPLYRVQVDGTGKIVTLLTEPKDQAHWPLAGQTVEILPWSALLPNGEKVSGIAGHISKIESSYNPNTDTDTDYGSLVITKALDSDFGKEWTHRSDSDEVLRTIEYFYMRVWDRGTDITSEAEIPFTPDTPLPLGNTGLQITIKGETRNAGTYWVIAARPQTPTEVLPWDLEKGLLPHGFRRFYAPLAIIHWKQNVTGQIEGKIIHDCRKRFRPLTQQNVCCILYVGDGVYTEGDFNSIEEALENLPDHGGKICLLPGIHNANVTITGKNNIHITGCDERSIIQPRPDLADTREPLFLIGDSSNIRIEHTAMITTGSIAVKVSDSVDTENPSRDLFFTHNQIISGVRGIDIQVRNDRAGGNNIHMTDNHIYILDEDTGMSGIFSSADNVFIERNHITVMPSPDEAEIDVMQLLQTARVYEITDSLTPLTFHAGGGIQIGCGSDNVKITNNVISGGKSNGITLGHLVSDTNPDTPPLRDTIFYTDLTEPELKKVMVATDPGMYDIAIQGNTIHYMGLSGIGVPGFFNPEKSGILISVEELCVYHNKISNCVQQFPPQVPNELKNDFGLGGIVLSDCENVVIRDNCIENNGISAFNPICGIFILYGEKIDISGNRIVNNGLVSALQADRTQRGVCGGIYIGMSISSKMGEITGSFGTENFLEGSNFLEEGIPAVKVINNTIKQPLGQAVVIIAMGPVSMLNNQCTTQNIDIQMCPLSLIAGAVIIMNLGISKNFINMFLTPKTFAATTINYEMYDMNATGNSINYNIGGMFPYGLFFPPGNTMVHNNQITLDLQAGEVDTALSSQLIFSMDDISYCGNQSDCYFLIDFLLSNTIIFGVTVRSCNNRFKEGLLFALFSLFSIGLANITTSNQATHCILSEGLPNKKITQNNMVIFADAYNAMFNKDNWCTYLHDLLFPA